MNLDRETCEIMSMLMDDQVVMPMPLVWKRDLRARRFVVLDGNHRIEASLRMRGELSLPASLVTGDTQVATMLALVVNTQHGRSTRDPAYTATAMRILREREVPVAQIARMFGVIEQRVYEATRRDEQQERVRELIPEHKSRVPLHTLDALHKVEDAHIAILGVPFLTATKAQQQDVITRLLAAPSSQRDALAHELHGELRGIADEKRKARPTQTKASTQLAGALQRLVAVRDVTGAYFQSSDRSQAVMRANLLQVLPRLQHLHERVSEHA
jgi:hypothetical protein